MPIRQRPAYPPKPVGVAIQLPGSEPYYFAWGHPTANNSQFKSAMWQLDSVWQSGLPIVFHNAKFDLAVAYEALKLPELPWQRVHDTMFLAYLCDPHARSLGLKELAADLLQWPADERNELDEWIWSHREQLTQTFGGSVSKKRLGEWIWAAPGDIVGRYACGDVARTGALFEHLWPIVQENGMGAAYDRERQLMPILMENERLGMRCDVAALNKDIEIYADAMEYVEFWLRGSLHASGLNFDADRDVASVLQQRGIVADEHWQTTKSGQLSTSKENLLPEMFSDPRIASALGYRNRLKTCLDTFMRPWLEQATVWNGRIGTNWNQVRNPQGGTRTGRPSTDKHNFLNLSKDFNGRDDGYVHPEFLNVAPLPLVRKYVLPDEGHEFLHRDFNQQEMRIFAHYEQGDLWRKYQADPDTNPHKIVGAEIRRIAQRDIDDTKVKVLNFQGLYGGGAPAASRKLRCSLAEAKELKAFHDKALPGRKILNEEIKRIIRTGAPIVTWGGRLYYCEPPGPDGRSKDYKLINYEIQGSAADLTKQSIIDWHGAAGRTARFLVTVYDEINVSAPQESAVNDMALLRHAMESRRLTVTMRSSPKHGASWGAAKRCPPEKGCQLCV